jgi:hypothetical protein
MLLLLSLSFERLEDSTCAKLQRLHWNAFIGGVDGLREIKVCRQVHRQEAIGLYAQAGEEAPVGDRRHEQWERCACRIGLVQDTG